MIEFYKLYIHPTSTHRAKIAVHLIAQGLAPPTVAATVIEKGMKALGLNKTEKDDEDGEVVEVKPEGNGTTPYVITDVREFKSKLQVSAGPQPVKHISEFEELDSKL